MVVMHAAQSQTRGVADFNFIWDKDANRPCVR